MARVRRNVRRSARETPESHSAAEQPLEPAEEASAALFGGGWPRCRCRPAGGGLGSCCRTAVGWRFGSGDSRSRRLASSACRYARSGCLLHLLIVAAQDGIRRHQAGCLLHLLVVSAQNRICRCCAHNRLLGGRRVAHCSENVIGIIRIPKRWFSMVAGVKQSGRSRFHHSRAGLAFADGPVPALVPITVGGRQTHRPRSPVRPTPTKRSR